MRIGLGSDHAGFRYKEALERYLDARGHEVVDFGTHSDAPADYPVFVAPVAAAVAAGRVDRGVVLGGSGNGEAMVANRRHGVRCALGWNETSVRLSREHNDANMLSLGARLLSLQEVLVLVDLWLATPFAGGRHRRRIELIDGDADAPLTDSAAPH